MLYLCDVCDCVCWLLSCCVMHTPSQSVVCVSVMWLRLWLFVFVVWWLMMMMSLFVAKKNINFFQDNRIKNKTKNPWKKKREQEGGAGEKIIKCAAYRETLFFLFFVNCFCKHRISDFFFRSWKKKQKTKQFSAFLGWGHQENKWWKCIMMLGATADEIY